MAGPLCLRLPEDLRAAVHQMAEQNGVSPSELVRDLIFRFVYGEPPGIAEGYMQGRAIGYQVAQQALASVQMPDNVEDAIRILQASHSPGRTPHRS